jgi:hypothetical protein
MKSPTLRANERRLTFAEGRGSGLVFSEASLLPFVSKHGKTE